MLVSIFMLCPFSVKISIKKFILFLRCFSVHILYANKIKSLNTPIMIFGATFEFVIATTRFFSDVK